ncbi:MAG TPA: valine--tRNA ligase [Gemmatimonadales bacterium]|jgi:valyl-tRNA synthetase|nr:valine--tRNA ligase [Gemmatimonadales bacterium]
MAYDPRPVEPRIYKRWLDAGAFQPRAGAEPYVIVIPPPNVTDILHVGHALNNVIQDVLIRFERMRGRAAEWLPGTDHAGIATQNVVEKRLAKEGKTRFDLGREQFVEEVWCFVKQTGNTIIEQLKVIGSSCDWSRLRFTFDDDYSRAVREVFVRLWDEGLIYRGHRVIHWCPHCLTALSDEEAEHHETQGNLYHIKYLLEDGSAFVTVATTRPETMFGDIGLVFNPKDSRYQALKGKRVKIPLSGVVIPIATDEAVEQGFGTGLLKVTPAHDANDFEIARRVWPNAETPLIMDEAGKMQDARRHDGTSARTGPPDRADVQTGRRVPQELEGMDRFDARKRIVKQLERDGLLVKTEPHHHSVRRCYRCDTVVEPRLSDQWFVKMKSLAERVMQGYAAGEFHIVPERWNATFENWMNNIRDWNISRQLWWGHRIPVFTCANGHQWADREDPEKCPKCGARVEQDPDVLDTWFSSWLWPFATFGWPAQTPDLARFYPGHTLVTGPDILFFWVARMLMSGYKFMGKKPFTTVYLHGIARDTKHRKMSKSLGNGIDPLVVVEKFGADALRWTCVANTALGQDLLLDPNDLETTFAPGRNFANKLWNIGQFVLAQLPKSVPAIEAVDRRSLTLADRWILSRAQAVIREATASLEQFRLDEAAKRCFEFVWNELADWYVEAVKPRLDDPAAKAVLAYCFDLSLRLLHPIVPFITEELWQKMPGRKSEELLTSARWPVARPELEDPRADQEFGRVKTAIEHIRSIRAEYRVPPKTRLNATIVARGNDKAATFDGERDTIMRLAQLESLALDGVPQGVGAHAVFGDGSEVVVALEGVVDVQHECRRLSEEFERLDKQLASLAARLTNASFVSRAPQEVVAKEREKEKAWRDQRDVLAGKLKSLGCS